MTEEKEKYPKSRHELHEETIDQMLEEMVEIERCSREGMTDPEFFEHVQDTRFDLFRYLIADLTTRIEKLEGVKNEHPTQTD